MVAERFDVFLVRLDPTEGHEIKKTRPCLIISPDEMNQFLQTALVAPMTTKGLTTPYRIPCNFQGKVGQIVLDQIRAVDKVRLVKRLGRVDSKTQSDVLTILGEMFNR